MAKREILILILPLIVAIVLFVFRTKFIPFLRAFLNESSHPLNLAILRIVVFGVIFYQADPGHYRYFASLPSEIYRIPWGFDSLTSFFTGHPDLSYALAITLRVLSVFGILGLWIKPIALLSGALTLYLFGLAQFVGKVNHDTHHIVWFVFLLALTPASHSLSLDRMIAAWRNPERWTEQADEPSPIFGLPLRLAMLLLGIVYFYPGLYKAVHGFPWWFSAENMQRLMWKDWFISGYELPLFRADLFPVVIVIGAVITVVFEMLYIVFVLNPKTRWLAFTSALTFHNFTFLTLNIHFMSLQSVYVIYVNWDKLFRWLGRKLNREELIVLFDGNCGICCRTAAVLSSIDLGKRTRFCNLHDKSSYPNGLVDIPNDEALNTDLHAYINGRWYKGVDCYARISGRNPILWIVFPFLVLPISKQVANRIYRNIADSRLCKIPLPKGQIAQIEPIRYRYSKSAIALTSSIFFANVVLGSFGKVDAFPVACFPMYLERPEQTAEMITYRISFDATRSLDLRQFPSLNEMDSADGSRTLIYRPLLDREFRRYIYMNRRAGMHQWILRETDPDVFDVKVRHFFTISPIWNHLQKLGVRPDRVQAIFETYDIHPDKWKQLVSTREGLSWDIPEKMK